MGGNLKVCSFANFHVQHDNELTLQLKDQLSRDFTAAACVAHAAT